MKVFIENETNSNLKNIHNEKTLELLETIAVARRYPYPYGFLLNTTAEDGDNVDVFIITDQELKRGDIVDCEVVGLMQQFEKSWNLETPELEEADHNVLAVLGNEEKILISSEIRAKLTNFVTHVFDNIRVDKTRMGNFLGKQAALGYIKNHQVKSK